MLKIKQWITSLDRPWQLVGTVTMTIAVLGSVNWLTGAGLYEKLLFPMLSTTPEVQAWSALVYAAVFTLGLPVAFLLWHWRDRNVRDQIENARKDINLKEFQEVQLRAAGALDEKLPEEARQQLQIAALHQLRGFLRGEYGESFRRPAFELLLAGHVAAMIEIDSLAVRSQFIASIESRDETDLTAASEAMHSRLNAVMLERMLVISEETKTIFLSGFPLSGRNFDLLKLNIPLGHNGLDLTECSFFQSDLSESCLDRVDFKGAFLVCANLSDSSLAYADFSWANLIDASLGGSELYRASFCGAHMQNALLTRSRLSDSHFDFAYLQGATLGDSAGLGHADFTGAIFDDDTKMEILSSEMTDDEIAFLRSLGARHVNDLTSNHAD